MSSAAKSVAVIGGGPAGLMAAEVLIQAGLRVDLYEAMPSMGRKFLVAGKGGLNLTHSEPLEQFLTRYGARRPQLEPLLKDFGPEQVRQWAGGLGVETFVGTSGRVFPVGMKTAPLLHAWLERLRAAGVAFHPRHQWLGWNTDNSLRFATPAGEISVQADAVILALGGGSWPQTGSTGAWVPLLAERGVPVAPLKPANCGFDVAWTEHFRARFAGHPLKSVVLSFTDSHGQYLSPTGRIHHHRNRRGGQSHLRLLGAAAGRDRRPTARPSSTWTWPPAGRMHAWWSGCPARAARSPWPATSKDPSASKASRPGCCGSSCRRPILPTLKSWRQAIKDLPIPLIAPRPLEEAISSAGGVRLRGAG